MIHISRIGYDLPQETDEQQEPNNLYMKELLTQPAFWYTLISIAIL